MFSANFCADFLAAKKEAGKQLEAAKKSAQKFAENIQLGEN